MSHRIHPDDALLRDVLDALAVVVTLPHDSLGRDVEGRPRLVYELGWGPDFADLRAGFGLDVAAAVAEAASDYLPVASVPEPRPYETGPPAQSWPQYLIELYEARPFLEHGTMLYAAGQAGVAIGKRVLKLFADRNVNPPISGVPVVFTEPVILGICYAHVRDNYHPRASIALSSYVRTDHPDCASPEHPSGGEVYVVQTRVGRRTYVYQISSTGICTDRSMIEGGHPAASPAEPVG